MRPPFGSALLLSSILAGTAAAQSTSLTVYVDPVALKNAQDLAKIELRTADDGVGNKTGVYHVVIQLNGAVPDLEAWAKSFDYGAILGVIDPQ